MQSTPARIQRSVCSGVGLGELQDGRVVSIAKLGKLVAQKLFEILPVDCAVCNATREERKSFWTAGKDQLARSLDSDPGIFGAGEHRGKVRNRRVAPGERDERLFETRAVPVHNIPQELVRTFVL